ncbi:16S rRNA (uracil(1498)-N(3))-methyltransferase [Croceiramulus getboli]|nr:16S rRNA (uracil(1498)-N(3))-methyltransferase [Flavobacteriaceae bacterium YJPT1-3]
MQLFYHPEAHQQAKRLTFSKEESRHIVKVLRKTVGDTLRITNGKGQFFSVEITEASQKHCQTRVLEVESQDPLPYELHLAVAPTKLNDRFEWFLEKATEIGVHRVTPLLCDHSERTVIKAARYERVLEAAMKQSLSAYLPTLAPLTPFSTFIEQEQNGLLYIAHCEDRPKLRLMEAIQQERPQRLIVLIGPEGDFSSAEIEAAVRHKAIEVDLGKSRLRTETAAIVACHTASLALH